MIMKKEYKRPSMNVLMMENEEEMMAGSPLQSLGSNLTGDEAIDLAGGGSIDARSREASLWDEE